MQRIAFYEAASVTEAIAVLGRHGPDAKVVAGSTALSIMLRQRLVSPTVLVSIARIEGLRTIDDANEELLLGALATHRDVELSRLVRGRIPALAETFGHVANVRVRNAATVGGVLAEADYASDPPTMLLALDAVVETAGPAGARRIPVSDFILGFYATALEEGEIVTGVRVPVPAAGTHGVYEKFVTRSSEDRPCVGVAALVRLLPDSTCADLRIALGATCEIPRRYPDLERIGRGTSLDDHTIRRIAAGYASETTMLDDVRGSSWYRRTVTEVCVRRAIVAARERARRAEGPR